MSKENRPNVWVTWPKNQYQPSKFESNVGLIIKFHSWDEYPYTSQNVVQPCTVEVLSYYSVQARFSAKLAFLDGLGQPLSVDRFRERNLEKEDLMSLADFQSRFGSFVLSIGDRHAYQEMFDLLRQEIALRLLLQVKDLVALNELRPKSKILRQVRASSHDLWPQFFREDEERFALLDFRRCMDNWHKSRTSLAHIESIEAEVPLWSGHYVLPLRLIFPEVLGQRQLMNVVIGPNGSGKTNLLLGMARCVVKNCVRVRLGDINTPEPSARDHYQSSDSIQVAVFTYERAMWASLRRQGVAVYEQGVRASDWRKLTQLIYEILSSRPHREALRDLSLLKEILAGFINVSELWFPFHPASLDAQSSALSDIGNDRTRASLEDLTSMSDRQFVDTVAGLDRGNSPFMCTQEGRKYVLSSGERSLVLFCARLMIASRDSALVLIDEPENHLHPKFITLMIRMLARTLLATGSRALLVTHSPFVVREFERSTVSVLKMSADGIPEIFRPSLQTLGADVAMISDYVFEDEHIRKGFQESIDRAIRVQQFQGGPEVHQLGDIAASLGDDAVSYLIERSEKNAGKGSDA